MITGAHSIIYSTDSDADRSFLRDVLHFTHVDVGGGWLIFGLPPSEVAVHPSDGNGKHELYLMCDDVEAFVAEMNGRNIACAPVQNQGWGLLTSITLPGGGQLGVYEPRHPRPEPMGGAKKAPVKRSTAKKGSTKRSAKKPAAKKPAAKKASPKKASSKKASSKKPAAKRASKKGAKR